MRLTSFPGKDPATKIASMAIAAGFLSLIAFQCYVFWEALQAESIPLAALKPSQTSVQNRPDIGRLAASHLFGDVESAAPQYSEVKEDRSLNLTLRGIVANSAGTSSLAIIESSPNTEETFAMGDNVFNKGTLDFVAADHVILARSNGQLARLQLPEQDSSGLISEEFLPTAEVDYADPLPEPPPEPIPVERAQAEGQPEFPLEFPLEFHPEAEPETEAIVTSDHEQAAEPMSEAAPEFPSEPDHEAPTLESPPQE